MKKKEKTLFLIFTLLCCTVILAINSCQKDLAVVPVYSERDVTGNVIDINSGDPVEGAVVTVVSPNSSKYFLGKTDNSGKFTISGVPVLPVSQKYLVRVEKPLYEYAEATINCDCVQLLVDTLKLRRSRCMLSISPTSTIGFGIIAVNEEKTMKFLITNPTQQDIVITKIEIPTEAEFSLSSTILKTPCAIKAGESIEFSVLFKPISEMIYNGSIKIYTQCSNQPYEVVLNGEGQTRKCDIKITPDNKLTASARTKTVTVQNLSRSLDLTFEVVRMPKDTAFKFSPALKVGTKITLAPLQTSNITVFHTLDQVYSADDTLIIKTDGDCHTSTIPLIINIVKGDCSILTETIEGLTIFNKEERIVIKNLSDITIKANAAFVNKTDYFTLSPQSISIPPKDTASIKITFNPPNLNGTFKAEVMITTTGSCGKVIPVTASYNASGYRVINMFLWDGSIGGNINSAYKYKGFRFKDEKWVVDSISLCGGIKFGLDSADIRFEGFTNLKTKVKITSYSGLQRIGNLRDHQDNFELSYYQQMIVQNAWTQGCAMDLNKGDVIAIKTREGKYVIALIDSWSTNYYDFDYLLLGYYSINPSRRSQ